MLPSEACRGYACTLETPRGLGLHKFRTVAYYFPYKKRLIYYNSCTDRPVRKLMMPVRQLPESGYMLWVYTQHRIARLHAPHIPPLRLLGPGTLRLY